MEKLKFRTGYKANGGITLIALIVTIIVTIIIAGISIQALFGDNGIYDKAVEAKEANQTGTEQEKIKLSYGSYRIAKDTKKVANLEVEGAEVHGSASNGWTIIFSATNNSYSLTPEGVITNLGKDDGTMSAIKIIVNSGEDGNVQIPIDESIECDIDWGDGTKTVANNQFERKINEVANVNGLKIGVAMLTPHYSHAHTYSDLNKEYVVTILGEVTSIGKGLNGGRLEYNKDQVLEIAQWGETGLTGIDLSYCTNLRRIAEPTEHSFENCTSFNNAFESCSALKNIPEELFDNCPNVTSFWMTFSGCTSITKIPEGLFDNCTNGEDFVRVFENCTSLTGYAPALWERQNVTYFSYAFHNCTGLTNYDEIPAEWK